jgi:hypothetical protein
MLSLSTQVTNYSKSKDRIKTGRIKSTSYAMDCSAEMKKNGGKKEKKRVAKNKSIHMSERSWLETSLPAFQRLHY